MPFEAEKPLQGQTGKGLLLFHTIVGRVRWKLLRDYVQFYSKSATTRKNHIRAHLEHLEGSQVRT